MHLHSLRFQAVGPFPGEHTIAFADLAAGGLFLLEGPTGSGKSTLIDMVVFALYGKVASREATEERLRSAHAEPTTETYVDLVLETGTGVYRVRRTPQYARPKQRGTGTTTQQATVKLWRLTDPDAPDHGELVSTRLDEAGDELRRVVGLDREQFVQTVVLPQGEFAGFLRAKPEDRKGLLQKVFGTDVYQRLQERLERRRAEANRAVDGARAGITHAVEGFVAAARLDAQPADDPRALAPEPAVDGERLTAAVEAHTDRLTLLAETAASAAAEAKQRCAAALTALDEARSLRARLDRRTALRTEHARLEAAVEDVERATAQRDAARRAATAMDAVVALDLAERAVRDAEDELAAVVDDAPADLRASVAPEADACPTEPADAADVLVRLHEEKDRCTGLLAVLDQLADVERALPARRAELSGLEASIADLEVRTAERRSERDGRGAGRTELEGRLADARTAAATLGAAQAAVTAAERVLDAAVDAEALAVELEQARRELARLTDEATTAVTVEARLRAARLAGIAGELAADLTTGEPCAVCGSTEHPAPARRGQDHVGADEVAAAEEARGAAERAVAERSAVVTRLETELGRRRADAGGVDVEEAKTRLGVAEQAVLAASTAERTVVELQDELRRFDEATVAIDQELSRLGQEHARQTSLLAERRTALATDEQRVTEVLDGCATVAARVALLRDRVAAVTAWTNALTAVRAATTAHAERRTAQAAALERAGLPDAAAVRAAHLTPAELTALEGRVEQHHQAVARVRHALAEPEIADLPEDAVVDVTAAAEAHRLADEEATRTAREAATALDRAEAAARGGEQVVAALRASQTVRAEAAPVIRMADLAGAAGSDNAKQLTLTTYVLMRRFEDVVAAANSRLRVMSSGRFELLRSDEKEAVRSRRTGLAMKVVDHHTGTERDPRTLSGGETFYVSLCLALGLADVVTAEAGGTDLGTLFVDEGFGTLDAETLEVVLAELGRLRDGGRVVGVVSHVEALKQSIAERIEVRRRPEGGSTITVRA